MRSSIATRAETRSSKGRAAASSGQSTREEITFKEHIPLRRRPYYLIMHPAFRSLPSLASQHLSYMAIEKKVPHWHNKFRALVFDTSKTGGAHGTSPVFPKSASLKGALSCLLPSIPYVPCATTPPRSSPLQACCLRVSKKRSGANRARVVRRRKDPVTTKGEYRVCAHECVRSVGRPNKRCCDYGMHDERGRDLFEARTESLCAKVLEAPGLKAWHSE